MKGIRKISGKNVPIYAWLPGSATAIMRMSGPEQFGGSGDLIKKCEGIKDTGERVKAINEVKLISASIIV